jgi:regulator of protease activity HflC (stomatin/prohibitin superfamily)
MGTIVFFVFLFLIVIGSAVGLAVARNKLAAFGVFAGAVAVFFLTWMLSSVTVVQGYQVGVPVTFGVPADKPLTSGIHLVKPWTNVVSYPIRPLPSPTVALKARTAQGGSVTVGAYARWSVIKQDAKEVYLQVRSGDEDKISNDVVDKLLKQSIGNAVATMSNSDAVSNRPLLEQTLHANLTAALEPYGIQVNTLSVTEAEPDSTTAAAIAQFAAQQRATQIAQEAQATATADAKRRLIAAQGLAAAANAVKGLTPTEVQALCVDLWSQAQSAATNAHVPLYTNPCAAAGIPVTVPAQ